MPVYRRISNVRQKEQTCWWKNTIIRQLFGCAIPALVVVVDDLVIVQVLVFNVAGLDSAKLTFADAVFGKNSGTYGGAVYSSASVGGTVNVGPSDVGFEGNTATSGGAVYLGGSGTSDIAFTDAVFKEKQANTGNGGAIYSGISGSSNLAIADSSFEGNSAGYGGAVFNNGQLATSGNVVFSGNTRDCDPGDFF